MADHKIQIRVYYEDTDAAGVIYHASYIRFAERGRTEMLRDIGFEHASLFKKTGVAFAVRYMTVDYKMAGRLDDLLTVTSRVEEIKGASMKMVQEIARGQEILAVLEVTLVAIDRDIKAVRLPDDLRQKFETERVSV